jgi:hypothetical protein
MGAQIRAQGAREAAHKANQEADRAEAEAWSLRMEGHGGPAQPSPTIGQCPNGGAGSTGRRNTGVKSIARFFEALPEADHANRLGLR